MKPIATVLAALAAASVSACASPTVERARSDPPLDLAGVPPGVVDGDAAQRLVAAGATIVDVRTPEEFATGHVPGALNIPHGEIARRAAEIGRPSTPVVVYCRTGRRSGIAAATLRDLGFTRIFDLRTYEAWTASARGAAAAAP